MLFKSIYDFRNSDCALFRLSFFDNLVGLRGEIQRLQYFDIRLLNLSELLISKARFELLRKTAHHSD